MKQAIMTTPGDIQFRQVAEPRPGPGEVLLHIRRIGVCGSDIHVWHGKHPFTPYPVVQGHEFSATVAATGSGVDGIPVGAKATALPQVVCGQCPSCVEGTYNICDNLKVEGFQAPGVAQDYFVVPAARVVVLPDSFSFEQGAFVEPCAVAVHATGRAGDLKGENVVVMGAGPIGNLVAQCARARGARVLLVDVSRYRLEVASQCGVEDVSCATEEALPDALGRVFGQGGFRKAFECAGAEKAMNALINGIRKGGSIVSVGLYGARPTVDMSVVCEHELSVVGTLMYKRPDYEQAVAWIAAGKLRLGPLDSKHFAFADYRQAYEFIDRERERTMKVFIDVN